MELANKVALITGAASGLGAQTTRLLADCAVKVVALDKDGLNENTGAHLSFNCDITDQEQTSKVIDEVIETLGAIHICVNCAGVLAPNRIVSRRGEPSPLADFKRVIEINLVGTFNIMRLVAAKMIQQPIVNEDGERGIIINVASIAAYEGQIGQAAYSASKGGIVALTLPAARELAEFGIRVMAIAPGVMQTSMVKDAPDKVKNNLEQAVLFPSRFGDPNEFAQLVAHIIENSYLNGSVIRLDAGLRMPS